MINRLVGLLFLVFLLVSSIPAAANRSLSQDSANCGSLLLTDKLKTVLPELVDGCQTPESKLGRFVFLFSTNESLKAAKPHFERLGLVVENELDELNACILVGTLVAIDQARNLVGVESVEPEMQFTIASVPATSSVTSPEIAIRPNTQIVLTVRKDRNNQLDQIVQNAATLGFQMVKVGPVANEPAPARVQIWGMLGQAALNALLQIDGLQSIGVGLIVTLEERYNNDPALKAKAEGWLATEGMNILSNDGAIQGYTHNIHILPRLRSIKGIATAEFIRL